MDADAHPLPPGQTRISKKPSVPARSKASKAVPGGGSMQDLPQTSVKRGRKRKATVPQLPPPGAEVVDLTLDEPTPKAKRRKPQAQENALEYPAFEKRTRKWRDDPPLTYLTRLARIRSQRMFVVGHHVGGSEKCPEISFDMVGSTGNIYKVVIGKVPTCDCPDGLRGNQCKHICYALLKALKAPAHLQYQLAFLSSELREIYRDSPLSKVKAADSEAHDNNGNRKPVEGDCPICFMEFEPNESIVWCKAACGNNIHKHCFEQWAVTTRASGVRCVYCRTPWKSDDPDVDIDIESLRVNGYIGEDGYVNVANQFGMSEERDYSIYSPFSTVHPSYYSGRSGRNYRSRYMY